MSRVALIVGGASGIGAATAHRLAEDGFRIALADRAGAQDAVTRLTGAGHGAFTVNVADETSVVALFDAVEEDLGLVAVLVNCAGIGGFVDGKRPSLHDTSLTTWPDVLAVNATGMFLCVREMLRRRTVRPVDDGRIIMIGSMAAQDGGKNSPPAYVASKGAVHALTKTAMPEAAALGMTVNCVAPGAIDTPLLRAVLPQERHTAAFAPSPLGRAGTASEVAAAVGFLASAQASFVTGACFDVNGGVRLS